MQAMTFPASLLQNQDLTANPCPSDDVHAKHSHIETILAHAHQMWPYRSVTCLMVVSLCVSKAGISASQNDLLNSIIPWHLGWASVCRWHKAAENQGWSY